MDSRPEQDCLSTGKDPSQRRSDLELVKAVVLGDDAARETFLDRMVCVPRFLQALNRRMGGCLDGDALDDLMQEVQLAVWRKLKDFAGRARLESWVYRFCQLALLQYLEKQRLQRERTMLLEPEAMVELAGEAGCDPQTNCCQGGEESEPELPKLLRYLSVREAEVTRLRHVEQLDFASIGTVLSISISSAKTHYYRGLEKLRRVLGKPGSEVNR